MQSIFNQSYLNKRQQLQVKIRKQKRLEAQSEYRHKILLKAFGYNPLTQNSYDIQMIIGIIQEYLDGKRNNIETLQKNFKEQHRFDSSIVGIFKQLYYSVERENQDICGDLQIKIIRVLGLLPFYNNVITLQSVKQFKIVEFVIDLFKINKRGQLMYTLYFINQISQNPDIKQWLVGSKQLLDSIESNTQKMTSPDYLNDKKSVPIIKLLMCWWGDIDFNQYNLSTRQIVESIYRLANQVISNHFQYLYTNQNQVNEINIVNALRIIHGLLDLYVQDMLQEPKLFSFQPNFYCSILDNKNIIEGKDYVIRIMAILILYSQNFSKEVVQNTDYPIQVVRIISKSRKTILVSIHNLLMNVGPKESILPAVQSLVNELLTNNYLSLDERYDIFEIVYLWMFHEKKGRLKPADYSLIQKLTEIKQPIQMDREIIFWKMIRKIGYRRGYPQYISQMELED